MTTKTYNALEGTLTVRGATTVGRTDQTNAVALVGGYDSNNAAQSVTEGESTKITSPTTAEDTFGASELSRMAQSVAANGASPIYGIPVPETQTTDSFTSTQSFTLNNTPIFDPNVHPDESVTVTDTQSNTDYDVTIVYDDTVTTPSGTEEANVNPISGDVKTSSSSDFDVQYKYGDYSTAIQAAVKENVRNVIVGTEDDGVTSTLQTELANRATDFDFMRGFVGADPEISTGNISSYTPNTEDWRIVECAPARGTNADGEVRTCAAIGGFMAAQPIDPDGSGLYEPVNGLTSLNKEYLPSEASNFDQVTALTSEGRTASTVTTSAEAQFADIYATEIIDDVALKLFGTARNYAGGPQDVNELQNLLSGQLQAASRGNPPQLGFGDGSEGNPYDVNVTLGNSNDVAEAEVTIVPYPVAKTVNLDITVSDGFIQFNGAN